MMGRHDIDWSSCHRLWASRTAKDSTAGQLRMDNSDRGLGVNVCFDTMLRQTCTFQGSIPYRNINDNNTTTAIHHCNPPIKGVVSTHIYWWARCTFYRWLQALTVNIHPVRAHPSMPRSLTTECEHCYSAQQRVPANIHSTKCCTKHPLKARTCLQT
jgi:hypothetical protein